MPDKRRVINCETLEIFDSITALSKRLKITPQGIIQGIYRGGKFNNETYDFYDDWIYRTDIDKEEFCYKNNIFFLKGKHKAIPSIEKYEKYKNYTVETLPVKFMKRRKRKIEKI